MHFVLGIFGSVTETAAKAGITLQITRWSDKQKCKITKLSEAGVYVDSSKSPSPWCREDDYHRAGRPTYVLRADDEARLLAVMMSHSFNEGESMIAEAQAEMGKPVDYGVADWVTFKALKHNGTFSSCIHRVRNVGMDVKAGMEMASIVSANNAVATTRKVPAWQLQKFDMEAFKAGGADWIINWTTEQLAKTPFGDQLSKHAAESKGEKEKVPTNITEITAFLKNRDNK